MYMRGSSTAAITEEFCVNHHDWTSHTKCLLKEIKHKNIYSVISFLQSSKTSKRDQTKVIIEPRKVANTCSSCICDTMTGNPKFKAILDQKVNLPQSKEMNNSQDSSDSCRVWELEVITRGPLGFCLSVSWSGYTHVVYGLSIHMWIMVLV